MNKKRIEELIRLVEDSDVSELVVSGPLSTVKIVKGAAVAAAPAQGVTAHAASPPAAETTAAGAEAAEEAVESDDRDSGLVPIESPMVGTFYSAPDPSSPPFVRQGDHVSKGQVVCIVEAMKLMNEIEAEVSGTVVRVAVENGKPVEFGQALFLVEPD
jgi:acetyl-CoA carboxylase biotin carboxyl carrier protein